MNYVDLLGFAAAIGTTGGFVPQVLKSLRTRRVKDLSWGMLLLFTAGIFLWLVYGVLTSSLPLIAANAVTLALVLVLVGLKSKYG